MHYRTHRPFSLRMHGHAHITSGDTLTLAALSTLLGHLPVFLSVPDVPCPASLLGYLPVRLALVALEVVADHSLQSSSEVLDRGSDEAFVLRLALLRLHHSGLLGGLSCDVILGRSISVVSGHTHVAVCVGEVTAYYTVTLPMLKQAQLTY
jgi:hypothetical protein